MALRSGELYFIIWSDVSRCEDDPENAKNADVDIEPEEEAVDAQATMKSIMDKTDDVYGEESEITHLHVTLNGCPI